MDYSLQPGDHIIEMTYDNDGTALFDNLLALFGVVTFFILLFVSLAIVFVPMAKREVDGEPTAALTLEHD